MQVFCTYEFAFTWFLIGKFGVVNKAYYKSEDNKINEVAVKTVKCVLLKLYRI